MNKEKLIKEIDEKLRNLKEKQRKGIAENDENITRLIFIEGKIRAYEDILDMLEEAASK